MPHQTTAAPRLSIGL